MPVEDGGDNVEGGGQSWCSALNVSSSGWAQRIPAQDGDAQDRLDMTDIKDGDPFTSHAWL
eukprot:1158369-Pelagomonas_calceolata.AAC.2